MKLISEQWCDNIEYLIEEDPKTGKKVEYELHSTHKDRKSAMEESRDLRADGQKARFTKAGEEFKVWVSKKTSDMMSWPY